MDVASLDLQPELLGRCLYGQDEESEAALSEDVVRLAIDEWGLSDPMAELGVYLRCAVCEAD